ncbi:hypothetical protein ACE10Z_25920 [Bradyrhizobium sp. Pha-3]|uniref:hypothetical protein n=1 Tax=Bradyrhizobium sp. Pha-3 TaxID=208375 RepID=UPI0035D3E70C
MPLALPTLAPPTLGYDLTLLKTAPQRGTDHDHGWCYGLPSGIRTRSARMTAFRCSTHLGGTMFPNQWTPKYSATYLEIEEHFGGFNFGGGNGQLDLASMEFDWACG